MTTPPMDWNAWFARGSQQHRDELDAAWARVADYYNQFSQLAAPGYGVQVPVQQPRPATPAWEDEDLVGAATYWGLPEAAARQLPRDALIHFVNQNRENARAGGQSVAANILAPLAQFGVGAVEGITGTLEKLPGFGDWFMQGGIVHSADMSLRRLEEGVRASTPQGEQGLESVTNVAGNLAAMWYPAKAAWAIAGKLGDVVPLASKMSPIGRAALRGGLASYLLEGGVHDEHTGLGESGVRATEDPAMHRAQTFVGGAVFGLAMEAGTAIGKKLAQRVTKAFTSSGFMNPGDLGGSGLTPLPAPAPAPAAPAAAAAMSHEEILQHLVNTGDTQAAEMLNYIQRKAPMPAPAPHGPEAQSPFGLWDETQVPPQPQAQPPAAVTPQQVPSAFMGIMEGWEQALGRDRGLPPDDLVFQDPEMRAARDMMGTGMAEPQSLIAARSVKNAEALATQHNKVAAIVQSSAFDEVGNEAILTDGSVARAMTAENPGGINIIQGVVDPSEILQQYAGKVTVAHRGDRIDVLLGDIRPSQVTEYEKHGMYTGQRVYDPQGRAGSITALDSDGQAAVTLYPWDVSTSTRFPGPDPIKYSVNELHPWLSTTNPTEAPDLWDFFNNFANQRAAVTQAQLGGAVTPQSLTTLREKNLALWMEQFFDHAKIEDPGVRDNLRQYFNARWIGEYHNLVLEEARPQSAMLSIAGPAASPSWSPVGALDQAAAVKGFVAVPKGGGKWTLRDMVTPTTPQNQYTPNITFETRDAAETWVKQVNRELPDITPESEVPLEVMGTHMSGAPQIPNMNAEEPASLLKTATEMDRDGEIAGGAGDIPPAIHAAEGNYGRVFQHIEAKYRNYQPARRVASVLDQAVFGARGQDLGISSDLDRLNQVLNQYHGTSGPMHDEAARILRTVSKAKKVSGEWAQAYEELDPTKRASLTADWSPAEVQSLSDYEALMRRMFQETGLDPNREIKQYFSHISQRQSQPDLFEKAYDEFSLGPATQPFYDMERSGNLNLRELDPDIVAHRYIRDVFWHRDVEPLWAELKSKYEALEGNDPELKEAGITNWVKQHLNIVKFGYDSRDDFAVKTMHDALRVLVDPTITEAQAKDVVLGGINASYSGLLGFKPALAARHFMQMTYALPRAGANLIGVLSRAVSGGMKDILNTAIADGAVVPGGFYGRAPGAFLAEFERAGAGLGQGQPFSAPHTTRYNLLAKLHNDLGELVPDFVKNDPTAILRPMGLFSKAIERFRSIVYVAGKERAAGALEAFRAGGSQDLNTLMGDSMARTFDPPYQREFQKILATGDDSEAAKYLGRQLVESTFFRYGVAEAPQLFKSVTGRIAGQLSHYPINYLQFVRETAANGTPADKARALVTAAITTAGLKIASDKTGWNLNYLNPWLAIIPGFGPEVGMAVALTSGVKHSWDALTQNDPSKLQMAGRDLGQFAGQAAMYNPAQGLVTAYKALDAASQSPSPALTAMDWALTGTASNQPEWNQQMMPQASQQFQQSLQPYSSPVRGGGAVGLPAGSFPTQPVTEPPLIQDPRNIPAGVPVSAGGQASPAAGFAPGAIEVVPRVLPQLIRR